MSERPSATLTSKGQITVPVEVRRKWNLQAGDEVVFEVLGVDEGKITPRRRRSIFGQLEELRLPSLGRPLTQVEMDDAIGSAIEERFARSVRAGRK